MGTDPKEQASVLRRETSPRIRVLYLHEAEVSVRRILEGLEAHPHLKFAVENPWTSGLWSLPTVQ